LKLHRFSAVVVACGALAFGVVACGDDEDEGTAGGTDTAASVSEDLSGSVRIDGSSTVQPVAEAAVELFAAEAPNVDISVGGVGTGDGFEKFCRGELQIADASRGIEKDEFDACKKANLKKLLDPKSKIANYKELGAGFPDQKVSFFTPGTESGTYDFFTETVLETDAEQRTQDVQTSADDNQIVTGIEGTEGALGYVGFAFADQQKDKLKILAVDGGEGCIKPEIASIADNSYTPLSRPLFMYPTTETAAKPEVKAFIQFILDNNDKVNEAADYVPLTDDLLTKAKANLEGATPVEAPTE